MQTRDTRPYRFDRRHEHNTVAWTILFQQHARRAPGHVAVAAPAGSGAAGAEVTYGELDELSSRVAQHLRRTGLVAGDVVATRFDRTDPAGVAWCLGVLKAGLCLYQLEPTLDATILCRRLASAGVNARLLVSDDAGFADLVRQRVEGVRLATPAVPEAPAQPRRWAAAASGDPAILVQSSGTTGEPKVIRIPYHNLADLADAGREHFLVDAESVHMQLARRTFDASIFELIVTLANGGTLALVPEAALLDARVFADQVVARGITHIIMTPTHMGSILAQLDDAGKARILGRLRHLSMVGEACPDAVYDELIRFVRGRITNSYGPSEVGIMATSGVMWEGNRRGSRHLGDVVQGSAIRIGVEVGGGWQVHAIEAGEAVVGPALIANGIVNVYTDDALNRGRYVTATDPVDGRPTVYFNSGDLVRVRRGERGPELEFIGRSDNQVKIAGQLVVTDEVRMALEQIPADRLGSRHGTPRFHVAAEADERQRLSLVCTFTAPSQAAATELAIRLVAEARKTLETYKIPSAFRWAPEFPVKTGTKLDTRRLAEIARPVVLRDARKADPTLSGANATEARLLWLATAAAEVVSEGITLDDRVDEIVADSLGIMAFQAQLRDAFSGTIDVGELPGLTLREVARRLQAPSEAVTVVSRLQRGTGAPYPLFLAPPGDGSPQVYMPLVKALGPECDVYGFRCIGSDPGEELQDRTLEGYAADWVAELVRIQPEGPIHLAGFCFGGVVVYEMAQQLKARGREVALVAMFDAPDPGQEVPVADEADLYSAIFHSMFGITLPAAQLRGLGEARCMLEALVDHGHRLGALPLSLEAPRVQRIIDLERATGDLVPAYTARPLDCDMVFFQGDDSPLLRWQPHPQQTWARLVPTLTVVRSAGDHLQMMRTENVGPLAEELRRRLDLGPRLEVVRQERGITLAA